MLIWTNYIIEDIKVYLTSSFLLLLGKRWDAKMDCRINWVRVYFKSF